MISNSPSTSFSVSDDVGSSMMTILAFTKPLWQFRPTASAGNGQRPQFHLQLKSRLTSFSSSSVSLYIAHDPQFVPDRCFSSDSGRRKYFQRCCGRDRLQFLMNHRDAPMHSASFVSLISTSSSLKITCPSSFCRSRTDISSVWICPRRFRPSRHARFPGRTFRQT